jgi:enamine deaminase RidA (YjgF/YER057c/UK114 family)
MVEVINPETLAPPRGYSHGAKGSGQLLFVAGQIGWDGQGRMVAGGFAEQFAQALDNVLEVVRAAGGTPESIARMVLYVTDKAAYLASAKALGALWRERLGRHYPAMAAVEVKALMDDAALVEIEAVALV